MGDISSVELIFFTIMAAIILLLLMVGILYFMDVRKKNKSRVQVSLESAELLNRIEKLEENYKEIMESMNGIEDYFSSMMYQIDDLAKGNKQGFQKINDYLMFLQQVKSSGQQFDERYYDIMNIDKLKKELKETTDSNKKTTIEENDLTEVFKRSQQIERAEMKTDDVGEMAKELNMSRGEIELVKQINQIKEKVNR